MRITIDTRALTPAQFTWLRRNIEVGQEWGFGPGHVRVCVTFESQAGDTMHTEMPVHAWVAVIAHLKTMTRTIEALLTPDALSPQHVCELPGKCWGDPDCPVYSSGSTTAPYPTNSKEGSDA